LRRTRLHFTTRFSPPRHPRFEDPHAFIELVEGLLDAGTATVVTDLPPATA